MAVAGHMQEDVAASTEDSLVAVIETAAGQNDQGKADSEPEQILVLHKAAAEHIAEVTVVG